MKTFLNWIRGYEKKDCVHVLKETGEYNKGIKNPETSTSLYSGAGFVVKCEKCGVEFIKAN